MTAPPAIIASADNPTFRRLRALVDEPREVKLQGRTVLVGAHLVEACLAAGYPLRQLLLADAGDQSSEVASLRRAAGGVPVLRFAAGLFKTLTGMPSAAALAAEIDVPQGAALPAGEDIVALDAVQDAGNLGTILRTVAAAGIRHVALGTGCAGAWSGKVLRAGQGAHFALDIRESVSLATWLPERKLPVFGAVAGGDASVYALDLRRPHAWVFGSEGQGHGDAVRACLDRAVTIPLAMGIESLNVATAAAVCLFEARRQRIGAHK